MLSTIALWPCGISCCNQQLASVSLVPFNSVYNAYGWRRSVAVDARPMSSIPHLASRIWRTQMMICWPLYVTFYSVCYPGQSPSCKRIQPTMHFLIFEGNFKLRIVSTMNFVRVDKEMLELVMLSIEEESWNSVKCDIRFVRCKTNYFLSPKTISENAFCSMSICQSDVGKNVCFVEWTKSDGINFAIGLTVCSFGHGFIRWAFLTFSINLDSNSKIQGVNDACQK